MAVGIGSFSDPETLPGLSHYLEHMLFMGSEQFPDENEYDAFLTRHGGSSNAFTELEYTNFHFDCSARALGRALERFAGFFTAPLCKEDALEREVNAVDHEFNDVLQNDSCRLSQLMCATSRDKHVYRKFTWGNKRSLWDLPQQQGVPVRERLLEYYAQHYGGERMSLCVMGGEQLDELEALVRRLFSGVRSGVGRSPTFERTGFPFEGSRLHITKSVNQQNVVNVTFQLPSLFDRYKTKAEDYIGHLVGHEGSGSFLSALKDRGWATEVMAGIDDDGYSRNSAVFLFTVSITLTEAGLAATPGAGLAAVALLFEYLTLLRSAGPKEWVYKEMRSIGDMKFRFEEEDDGMDFVTSVASRMPHFSVPYLLFGHYCHELWDPQLVQQLLELMTPHSDGFRVDVQAHIIDRLLHDLAQLGSALQTSQEPWFHFPFHSCDLPQDLLTSWADAAPSSDLRLPPANCYIPTDFALLSPAAAPAEAASAGGGKDAGAGSLPVPPAMVADEPGMRVWYKMDSTFLTPRCNVYFRIASPVLARSAREAALAALLVKVLEDAVNEDTYLADIAGLHWCVSAGGCAGLDLRIDGFNQQLPLLAAKLMQALAALQPNPRTFAAVQEALVRRLRNANLEPGRLASYLRLFALGHHRWHVDELLAEAEKLQPQDIPAFRQQLLAEVHLEMLAIGNISQTQALSVAGTAAAALASGGSALAAAARPSPRCLKLREGSRLCHVVYGKNPDNENSACENYWQCGPDTPRARALVELLEQLMHEPCYDTLRTKQQLGYVVQSGMRCTHGVLGFFIAIVSSSHSASHLDSCIDQFLTDYARQLKKLPRKELEENVASLVELQLEKCRNLTEEGDRHWDTIWGQKYDFRRRAAVVGELRSISLKDMVKFFNTNLLPSAATARKLSVQVRRHGQQPAEDPVEDGRVVVPDLGALKASLDAYPAFTRAPQPHQQRKR